MSHKGNDEIVDAIMDREVEKPEKKENESKDYISTTYLINVGYNQACKEWEEYLPDNKEIESLVQSTIFKWNRMSFERRASLRIVLAKAISKRIGGK